MEPPDQRRAVHAIMMAVTLVRVLARQHCDDGAIAMLVWNGLALLGSRRRVRVPAAIVVRGGGQRRWRLPHRIASPAPEPDRADIGQWRPLEPYVLEARPWT